MRGHCGLALYEPSYDVNIASAIRAARAFGADYVCTVGHDYDGHNAAVGHDGHLPVWQFDDWAALEAALPFGTDVVPVELDPFASSLPEYRHPERALYVLGNEGAGLPMEILDRHRALEIPSEFCLNVAMAGNVVLYDRYAKSTLTDPEPEAFPVRELGELMASIVE